MPEVELPHHREMLWPTLRAVLDLGGSGSIPEIVDTVVKQEAYTDDQLALVHLDGPRPEVEYRLAWARTYLKRMGLLTNSERAVWALTEAGAEFASGKVDDRRQELANREREMVAERRRKARKGPPSDSDEAAVEPSEPDDPMSWKEDLLAALMALTSDGFERLAMRLLREADFESVTVTGRSGDGGIDGVGIYRLGLLSFRMFFQCKRYQGSVGAGMVRDFRGAMAGRGDKGLLITTGKFTASAKQEATRDGAPPIDLVDGDRLCDLLKQYGVGVRVQQVEQVIVEEGFFQDI